MENGEQFAVADSTRFRATSGSDACTVCGKGLIYDEDKLDGLCDRCKGAIDLTGLSCCAA